MVTVAAAVPGLGRRQLNMRPHRYSLCLRDAPDRSAARAMHYGCMHRQGSLEYVTVS